MFRRRRAQDDDRTTGDDSLGDELLGVEDGDRDGDRDDGQEAGEDRTGVERTESVASAQPSLPRPVDRPQGPWDSADVPADDETPRLDLGSVHVPVPEGIEVRVDVQDDAVVAATLVDGDSAVQIHAFAAPRSAGLWDEVRREIADGLTDTPGSAEETDGVLGRELRTRLPDEEGGTVPARFVGVDGPRWFLRGLFTGPAALDSARAARLEDAFRAVVVVRGAEAMAPRDMLPLRLPREVTDGAEPGPQEDGGDAVPERRLELAERGPEITEIQ